MNIKIKNTNKMISLWWCISKVCNFNCPYCIQGRKENARFEHISNEEALNVARHLKKLFDTCGYNEIQISITGGEPTLYDLPEIITILRGEKYHLTIMLLTNFSLHDVDWWNSLKKDNVTVNINASCHLTQIKDYDAWIDKASKLTNVDMFKVKYIISDENFSETKSAIEKCTDKKVFFCLEGARSASTQNPLYGKEVEEYISNSNKNNPFSKNTLYKYDGCKYTHTELVHLVHQTYVDKVTCIKRITIRGNVVESGCPYKFTQFSIYSLKSLEWQTIKDCDKLNICNLCHIGEISDKKGDF